MTLEEEHVSRQTVLSLEEHEEVMAMEKELGCSGVSSDRVHALLPSQKSSWTLSQ
jgi:hypothetical protein